MATPSYPRTFFLRLLAILMLYVSVIFVLVLTFQYINILFPDPLNFWYQNMVDAIRSSMATLFVVFPVLIIAEWLLQRELRLHQETAEYRIRKWLLYLTIFLAGLAIIIDIITLVNTFLGGETTVRFFLKVAAVLSVTGLVFGYELWEARRTTFQSSSVTKLFGWGSTVLIVALLASSFVVVGSPAQQRKIRLDEQRINDMRMIQSEIVAFWQQKNTLPQTLAALSDDLRGYAPPVDPVTGNEYVYKTIDDLTFELCAVFDVATPEPLRNLPGQRREMYPGDTAGESWIHEAGETCFERTIDPELYSKQNGRTVAPIELRF